MTAFVYAIFEQYGVHTLNDYINNVLHYGNNAQVGDDSDKRIELNWHRPGPVNQAQREGVWSISEHRVIHSVPNFRKFMDSEDPNKYITNYTEYTQSLGTHLIR